MIQLDNGTKVNRHVDHVRVREHDQKAGLDKEEEEEEDDCDILPPPESSEQVPEVPGDWQEQLPPSVMADVPTSAVGNAPALR